jgi:hypothetical protein
MALRVGRSGRLRAARPMELNAPTHRRCVAPMMDWNESFFGMYRLQCRARTACIRRKTAQD